MRSRKVRTIAWTAAVLVLALSAVLLASWDSLVLWARLSGVKEIYVKDAVLGEHTLASRADVLHAVKETRRFIASLAPKPPADVEIVGGWSEVVLRTGEVWSGSPHLWLNHVVDGDKAVFVFCDSRYLGDGEEWYRYLGRMLLPARASLEAAWNSRGDAPSMDVAGALLLIAPETEGVLDFVCKKAMTDVRALWLLVICADRSEKVVGCLDALPAAPWNAAGLSRTHPGIPLPRQRAPRGE